MCRKIEKRFIPSIANIVGTDLSSYKIVRTGQFAYGPVTSRNGEKISAWLGSGKKIAPFDMGQVMTDVLESPLLRTVFGLTDLNRTPKKWYWKMKKYEVWYKEHGMDYPVNWVVSFDEGRNTSGSYYCFTRCPICEFCRREGIAELMPALCATDEVMFRLQHGKLYREHTIANGDEVCDYLIVGDREKEPRIVSRSNGGPSGT